MAFNSFPQKLGIPSGTTAQRPTNPVIGDTYYDGTLGFLLIWDGTAFIPCSAPAAQPSISVADVGTSQPYAAPTAIVTFTEGASGGKAAGFTAIQGASSATSTSSPITIAIAAPGASLAFSGTAYNGFGTSPQSITVNQAITSLPQAPTIGTATASGSANEVTVTWTNGATGGKALSAITITPYLNGTTAETARTAATTSSTSYTFTDGQLTNAASYTFKVKATNANGTSLESAASNSATMPNFLVIDYLVVAGGGGGGNGWNSPAGGGGGAGGLRSTVTATGGGGTLETALSLSLSTNYTVTVGAGGTGGAGAAGVAGAQGTNSVFSTITSTGGGGGGAYNIQAPTSGGSGGGEAWQGGGSGGGGAASPANQGFAGGVNTTHGSGTQGGGGGGGAGAVGGNTGAGTGGTGGAGVAVSITGSSVTYGGGGGGGGGEPNPGIAGTATGGGGAGGAWSATIPNAGVAGTVNTGGGGGGCGGTSSSGNNTGGTGGRGVVILRYADSRTITIGAGLTGTESAASGGYKRATITAGTGNVSWA